MNANGGDNTSCYFHPNEVVVGVCALCLKERLLILASKQGQLPSNNNRRQRNRSITLSSVFALGSFLRPEPRHRRAGDDSDEASVASLEDSFISIKFGDNGDALWDKNTKKATCIKPPNNGKESNKVRSVVEQGKHGGGLRWRKQIGQLLQLARWSRSNKAATCHAELGSNVEGAKGRRGWIRMLTRRRRKRRRTTTTAD
ncbi:uncharacterized protein [Typha latifolia]|uniref:uncharacterized protein n=1 Tax=Typha latifolia TaxID=4733 RepID=UPI003C2D9651